MKKQIFNILTIILFLTSVSFGQTEPDSSEIVQSEKSELFVMTKSPWGAVARSAILPGWGQFYNESYWKAPIFLGAIGGLIYGWIYYNDLYHDYRDLYTESLIDGGSGNQAYLSQRNLHLDNRDLFAIYIGLVYFLNLVDAYVDAHLFDFSVSENRALGSRELEFKFYFDR